MAENPAFDGMGAGFFYGKYLGWPWIRSGIGDDPTGMHPLYESGERAGFTGPGLVATVSKRAAIGASTGKTDIVIGSPPADRPPHRLLPDGLRRPPGFTSAPGSSNGVLHDVRLHQPVGSGMFSEPMLGSFSDHSLESLHTGFFAPKNTKLLDRHGLGILNYRRDSRKWSTRRL